MMAGFLPGDRLMPSAIPGVAMGFVRWFTRNWADTSGPSHPDLYPVTLPVAPASALEIVKRVRGHDAALARGIGVRG